VVVERAGAARAGGWRSVEEWARDRLLAILVVQKNDIDGRGPKPSGRSTGWRSVMIPALQRSSIK
jgi:hypothetical protein